MPCPILLPRGHETKKRQHHKAKNKKTKTNQAGRPFVSPRKTKHRGGTLVKKAELKKKIPKRGLPSQLPRGEQGGTQSPPLSATVSTSSYHEQNEGGRLTVPTAGKSPTILSRPHPPQPDSYLSPSPVSSATVAKYSPPQTHTGLQGSAFGVAEDTGCDCIPGLAATRGAAASAALLALLPSWAVSAVSTVASSSHPRTIFSMYTFFSASNWTRMQE